MRHYLRVAGYTFLALCGLTAWLRIETGWRHYAGCILFFAASLRVFTLLKQHNRTVHEQHPQNQQTTQSSQGRHGDD
ncbi:MAG: hypothetical protein N3B18_08685 [Desulfobacterota bacterium]|nr:hypothetical protein [Thermodesulfobacteriota bacterium]